MKKGILGLLMLFFCMNLVHAQKRNVIKRKKVNPQTSTQTVVAKQAILIDDIHANTMLLCPAKNGMPVWYLAIEKDFFFPPNFEAPSRYKLTSINDKQLNEYLHSIPYEPSNKHISIPLYISQTIQCKDFMIERTVTMDSALQAKYPELMSFKAFDKENHLNEVRIDCDGTSTKFMVKYNGETYFVNPILYKGQVYYATYSKNDPNFIKKKFER